MKFTCRHWLDARAVHAMRHFLVAKRPISICKYVTGKSFVPNKIYGRRKMVMLRL